MVIELLNFFDLHSKHLSKKYICCFNMNQIMFNYNKILTELYPIYLSVFYLCNKLLNILYVFSVLNFLKQSI